MPLSTKDVLARHDQLRRRRAIEESEWREIATLIHPEQRDIGNAGTKRNNIADDIFDSTPLLAKEQFVGGLFSQATNGADRWCELGVADEELGKWGPVRDYLYQFTNLVLSSFAPSASPFYAMIPASYADLGVFGTGCGYSDYQPGAPRFTDLTIPLAESFVEFDSAGFVYQFNREYRCRGDKAKRDYGDAAKGLKDDQEYTFVHAVFPNPAFRPGALGPRGQEFTSLRVVRETNVDFRLERGYFEMPYWAIPWNPRANRYATGPGHLSRPDVNMLNEMERTHIVAAQFDAEPPLLAHDESVLTAADIEPGKVLHGALSENGKLLLQRLEMGSKLQLSMAQSEQRRAAIREAWLFSIMQLVNRPQMTATEFLGFKEEQLRLMGPNLGRIHTYGLAPLVARRARLLQRAGMVPPPPRELQGQNIEVVFTSPLARAQKVSQARTILQFAGQVIQLAQTSGRPDILDKVDFDAAVDGLGEGLGVPAGIVRDDQQAAAIRQARAQQAQEQAGVEQAAVLGKVYADVAHADQAMTRSQERTGRAA